MSFADSALLPLWACLIAVGILTVLILLTIFFVRRHRYSLLQQSLIIQQQRQQLSPHVLHTTTATDSNTQQQQQQQYQQYQYQQECHTCLELYQIHMQTWNPIQQPSKAIVLFLHGYSTHGGKIALHVNSFIQQGITIISIDWPGHGKSSAYPAMVNLQDNVDILNEIINIIKAKPQYSHLPCFLMGFSLGGLIAAHYLARRHHYPVTVSIQGFISIAACFQLPQQPPSCLLRLVKCIADCFPEFGLLPPMREHFQSGNITDPTVVAEEEADPLSWHGPMPALTAVSTIQGTIDLQDKIQNIDVPCLIFHGKLDGMTAAAGSQLFYDNIKHKDKTIQLFDNARHVLLREPNGVAESIIRDTVAWIHNHAE